MVKFPTLNVVPRYCSIAGEWANSSSLCTFQPGREEEGLVGEGPGLRLLPPPLQPTLVVPAVAPAVSRAIRVILLVLAAHHLALARDPDSAARRGGRVLQSHGGGQSRYIRTRTDESARADQQSNLSHVFKGHEAAAGTQDPVRQDPAPALGTGGRSECGWRVPLRSQV